MGQLANFNLLAASLLSQSHHLFYWQPVGQRRTNLCLSIGPFKYDHPSPCHSQSFLKCLHALICLMQDMPQKD